jgi:hypothetical protein
MSKDLSANPQPTESSKGTLCVKCEHVCSPGLERCDRCGAHLYILCALCGHKNARAVSRCEMCKHRLHKSAKDRVTPAGLGSFNLLILAGAILVVVVAVGLIIWLADLRLW